MRKWQTDVRRWGSLGLLVLLAAWGNWAAGAEAAKNEPLKTYEFNMSEKPWKHVLEWLADEMNVPFVGAVQPTGTFKFIAPRNKKKYTMPEIIDILNEGLVAQKYVLIRRPSSFTIVAADEKIDPAQVPVIDLKDLDKYGGSEIVRVQIQLHSLVAEDLKPEMVQLKGPFGEIGSLSQPNQLIIQDTVKNIRNIYKTIKDMEDTEKANSGELSYKCKYIKARDAAAQLTKLLGDPVAQARANQPAPIRGDPRFGPPPAPATPTQKVRMHYISSDDRTNTVYVTGPANKVAQAKSLLEKLDLPQKGQQMVRIGPPFLQQYKVPGRAEALAKSLQAVFKTTESLSIIAVSKDTLSVWATPEDQTDILKQIEGTKGENTKTQSLTLHNLEPAKAAELLQLMFPDSKNNHPFIGADPTRNAVVVKGTDDQISEVKDALKAIGEGGGANTSGVHYITLDKGSAATLAEALQRILPQMLNNPVHVITPNGPERKPEPKKEEDKKPKKEEIKKEDAKSVGNESRVTMVARSWDPNRPVMLAQAPKNPRLVDPQDKKDNGKKHGKASAPVTITAFGNRIIIKTDDPEAMTLINELIRLLTQTPGGEGDFEVIKLKFANAVDTAKVIDEAFNGPKQAAPQQSPFGGFRFGGPPPAAATTTTNRVRVVADPQTQSLLVRASPLDMLTVRRLLDKIDVGETNSTALIRTWPPIKLKYALAADVASTIENVYREIINETPKGSTSSFRNFFLSQIANQSGQKRILLSVGTDTRSNSIIISAPDALYKDVEKLTKKLDEFAKDDKKTVTAIQVDLDPALFQQALDAIQGRRTIRTGTGGVTGPTDGQQEGPPNGRGGGGRGRGTRGRGGPGEQRSPSARGPDFFAQGVTDDPQPTLLFDPQQPVILTSHKSAGGSSPNFDTQPVSTLAEQGAEEQEQAEKPAQQEGKPLPGFRGVIRVEPLEGTNVVVISGENPADVKAAIEIIRFIQEQAKGAFIEIRVVYLDKADATSVASILSQMFQHVIVNTAGNSRGPLTTTQRTTVQNQPNQPNQPAQQVQTRQQQLASVTLLPLPRQNAILMAAPRARLKDVIAEIKKLDIPTTAPAQARPFSLKKASAARVTSLLTQFYASRYPNESSGQHQIRFTFDEASNTIFVQAAPADMEEIKDLIERIDSTVSSAVNDVRIVRLRNAVASDLATLILQSIAAGVATPSSTGAGNVFPTTPGGNIGQGGGPLGGTQGGAFGQASGRLGGGPGGTGLGAQGLAGGGPLATTGGTGATVPSGLTGPAGKYASLRFFSSRKDVPNVIQAGRLEDVHITPDIRTNSLVLAAPESTMPLLLALINELDVVPSARAEINIFTLRKADAASMANMLQQLFLATGTPSQPRTASPVGGPTGTGGAPAAPTGGIPAATAGGQPGAIPSATGAVGATGGVRPLQLTLGGYTPEGAPIIELRITVDERTNSLVVAGSRNDLDVIEAIISRLEDSNVETRRNEVYKLKNAVAADVAAALNDFLTRSLTVLVKGSELTPFQEIQRDVVISYEPISNSLLISATPRYFEEVMHLIAQLDAQPPQVMIQVLIAEVDLTGDEEFGVEIGLQSPVLFQRSLLPSTGLLNNNTVTIANPATGTSLSAPGVGTVGTQQTANPGFNFNTTPLPVLGNNPLEGPGIVGYQGVNNLGVGRVSPTAGVSGFVFSASSNTFNLLVRALKTQGRMDILSRPQVMTLDNQTAFVQVGQRVPYITGSSTTLGTTINTVAFQNTGVILSVTPKINPDGTIVMRVDPQVSSVAPTTVNLGNGQNATAFNIQEVQTTVVAGDGETVALGGLISSRDEKMENKVPWFGDLPYLGVLFRYRTQTKSKTELVVILTPHIVHSRDEADRILAEEAHRMDWCLGDVVKYQGTSGMEPLYGVPSRPKLPPPAGPAYPPTYAPGTTVAPPASGQAYPPLPRVPGGREGLPPPAGDGREELPQPRPVPPRGQSMAPGMATAPPGVPVHYTVPTPPPEE